MAVTALATRKKKPGPSYGTLESKRNETMTAAASANTIYHSSVRRWLLSSSGRRKYNIYITLQGVLRRSPRRMFCFRAAVHLLYSRAISVRETAVLVLLCRCASIPDGLVYPFWDLIIV